MGNSNLNYQIYCSSFLGCVDVSVVLSNLSVTLVSPVGGSFTDTGRAEFGSSWRLQGNYVLSSALFSGEGVIDTVTEAGFGANFNAFNGDIFINQLALGSILGELPNDFNLVASFQANVDLGSTTLSGTYDPLEPPPPPSCGSGESCGGVQGPGCQDIDCCSLVCDIDYGCCEFGWDDACVNLAVELCNVVPSNDSCENARPLPLGRQLFTTINASTSNAPYFITECASYESGSQFVNDIWFSHTAIANNGLIVSTCDLVDFDTRLAVYSGCNGELIACSDNSLECSNGSSRVSFLGTKGQTYLIRLGGSSGSGSGEIDIAWGDIESKPNSLVVKWPNEMGGNDHYYGLYSLGDNATFQKVLDISAKFGGYPATITSQEEQDFINSSMPAKLMGGFTSIGLVKNFKGDKDSIWEWITGEPFIWSNWSSGEPNNAGGIENHVMMYPDGTWNDSPNIFGHVLIEFDSDPSLDQVVWDYADGGNGQTYQAVILNERVTWSYAKTYAENRGGYLVCFETQEESDWVFNNLGAFSSLWSFTPYNGGPWLGLIKSGNEWVWLSNTILDWNGWVPGEPNGTGDRACWYGSSTFFNTFLENFNQSSTGELFGSAQYADVFGNSRLKLVSDGQAGTWGTWVSSVIPDQIKSMTASFRFSFKNEDGGPGDGFSFLWGDLSNPSGNRMEGGESGINAFNQDGKGLSIGFQSYPANGNSGVTGRWGSTEYIFKPLEFESVTYSDYQEAGRPENMPTMIVQWVKDAGTSVSIAYPSQDPQVVWFSEGVQILKNINPQDWSFGFASRNGAIDMDVLLGDFEVSYEFLPNIGNISGGPRNTFDDTFSQNTRRSFVIEFDAKIDECPEDINSDGIIDVLDLLEIIGTFGTSGPVGDTNVDGFVDVLDLLNIISRFGQSC